MSDPQPVASRLQEARAALAARARPAALDDEDAADDVPARPDPDLVRRRYRWEAACPSRFLHATVDDFDGKTHAALADWSSFPDRRNLILFGPVGAGKSHAAAAACRPLVWDAGLDFEFLPVGELLDRIWSRSEPGALVELATVDLLVIDDLGSEKMSEWETGRLYTLVNRRWMEERPTVATTNADPTNRDEGLEAVVGPRTFSRLVGGAVTVRISGQDRRRADAPQPPRKDRK